MEYLEKFANTIYIEITNRLTAEQMIWIMLILGLLVIVLMVVMGVRNRKYQDALDTIDRQADEALNHKQQAHDLLQTSQRELKYKENILEGKSADYEQLKAFYENYKGIPEAHAEAKKLIAEAQDYVQDVKGRAEREYTEIVMHAQSESNAIREMAEGILKRSHETLRNALDRADKLIVEAGNRKSEDAQVPESVQKMLDELAAETALPDSIDLNVEPTEASVSVSEEAAANATESNI